MQAAIREVKEETEQVTESTGSRLPKDAQSHLRHYMIVIAGITLYFGPVALVFNSAGIFFPSVTEALDIGLGELSWYITLAMLAVSASLPVWGRLVSKHDVRITYSVAVSLAGIPMIAMGSFTAIWQFYLAGIVMGTGMAVIMYLAVPTLVNRWFTTRVGFFMGLVMAFSGIGGVVFNSVGGYIISTYGYVAGYRTFGLLILVLCLPFTLFVIRNRPADVGLLPYGAEGHSAGEGATIAGQAETRGVSASVAMRLPVFFALAVFGALVQFDGGMFQMLASYGKSLPLAGYALSLGATLSSFAFGGQVAGKFGLGAVFDKSVFGGVTVAMACGGLGMLLLWLVPTSMFTVLTGGVLLGVFNGGGLVMMPLLTRATFGSRDYTRIFSRVSMIVALVSAFGVTIWGYVIDSAGYGGMFAGGLVLMVLAYGLATYTIRYARTRSLAEETVDGAPSPSSA